ncbi:MAG: hypothetical protein PHR19_09060 [Bacteroidales bacterium]|nr:hypothetical protein [Bacteroidales bacterium]
MLSKFVHFLYKSSITVPYIFVLGIWQLITKNKLSGILLLVFVVLNILIQRLILRYAKHNLVQQDIKATNVQKSNSFNEIISIIISSVLPLIGSIVNLPSIIFWLALLIGSLIFVLLYTNDNPIVFIFGYTYYSINTEQGVDMKLISKRNIRNKNKIGKVVRIFEFVLMEV